MFEICGDKENDAAARLYVESDGRKGLDFGNDSNVAVLAKEVGLSKPGSFRAYITRCDFKKEKGFTSNVNPKEVATFTFTSCSWKVSQKRERLLFRYCHS